jgi:hypothetical protein
MPWNPAGGRIGRIAPIGRIRRIARIESDMIAYRRRRIGNSDREFPGSCAR